MKDTDAKKLNKLWARSSDLKNPQRDRHMFDLALFLWNDRRFDEAVAVTGALIDSLVEQTGSSLWIEAMHLRSITLHDLKRDEEAIDVELSALEYGEVLAPANDRGFMHWHLADCYRTTQQRGLQEREYEKAINAFKEADNRWQLGQAHFDLANLLFDDRKVVESKNSYLLALPLLEETSRTEVIAYVKHQLSNIERAFGNFGRALNYAEEALELSQFINDVIGERENLIEVALVHEALGNFDFALNLLDSVADVNDEARKNQSAAKAHYYRARILECLGGKKEALEAYEKAIPLLRAVNLTALAVNAELAVIHFRNSYGDSVICIATKRNLSRHRC